MKTLQAQINIIDWDSLLLEDQQAKLDEIKKTINRSSDWSDILLCLSIEKSIIEDLHINLSDSFRWTSKELIEDIEGERTSMKGVKANLKKVDSGKTLLLQTELRFGSDPSGIFAEIEL